MIRKRGLILPVFLALLLVVASPVSASDHTELIINSSSSDGFEDGFVDDDWTLSAQGNTDFIANDTLVKSGSWSAKIEDGDSLDNVQRDYATWDTATLTNNSDVYNVSGWIAVNNVGSDPGFGYIGFRNQTTNKRVIAVVYDNPVNQFQITVLDGNSVDEIAASSSHSISSNTYYFVNISYDSRNDEVTAVFRNDTHELASLTTTEKINVSQIHFGAARIGYFDDIRVENKTLSSPPIIDNTTASPTGDLDNSNLDLEIQINDSDFPTEQGDSVDVDFDVKAPGETSFSTVGTDTITSNQTASVSYNPTDGGTYQFRVNATDEYGALTTSQTFSFSAPSNVTFRSETNASKIVTGVSLTATFFSVDGTSVIQKTDSNDDGNISLAGLPTANEFVVVVEADEYYTRRIYIESIYTQSNIYLLNSTEYPNAIDTTFVYEDRTNNFPSDDTTLRIQRAVDVDADGTFSWETVAGDFWGAAGEFPFTGETNARYRLLIENSGGTQRNLGTHIPTADGTKNIIVGQLEWPLINGTAKDFDAEVESNTNSILATYFDPDESTTEVRIRVWELGNKSNLIVDQTYSSGPYGTLNANLTSLNENQQDKSWVVNATAETTDDGTATFQVTTGGAPIAIPLDPWLLGTFAWIGLTFVATLYGPRTATLGAGVLNIFAAILMILQLVYIPAASLIAGIAIFVGGTLYKEALP